MIIGHLGVAAAGQRWRPRASLPWLMVASVAPDLLDIALAVAGVCNPFGLYSHTGPVVLLLGACLASVPVLRGQRETGVLVMLMVLLHLPLDFVTGRKLYWPGGEMYGLGLYDHPMADFLLESALATAGWLLLRTGVAAPRWATAIWSIAGLVAVQGVVDQLHQPGGLKPNACSSGASDQRPEPRALQQQTKNQR